MAWPMMDTLSKYRLPTGAAARKRSLLAGLLLACASKAQVFSLLGSEAAPGFGLNSSSTVQLAPPS
ncbi:hypothetical protein D3C80_2118830 [compost metagenome]